MARVAAKRHAQAAFQIALERDELETWRGDLERLSVLVEDPLIFAFLESPRINFEEKTRILRQGLEGVNPLVINLALLMVTRGRLDLVADMVLEYGWLVDEHRGIAHAEVATAVPIELKEKDKLIRYLGDLVGLKIALTDRVDPSIIGGLVARVGDKIIDGSTRSRLHALRASLLK
ncbi:MAG: ATP synthase F1 subunit delta [Dehalococcoidia bacterium]|jgi:F-type H+-transporting ATPase subunit delta|nr:ATP synthase F1 subunit delta [Dehalococcoidia bacterium]